MELQSFMRDVLHQLEELPKNYQAKQKSQVLSKASLVRIDRNSL